MKHSAEGSDDRWIRLWISLSLPWGGGDLCVYFHAGMFTSGTVSTNRPSMSPARADLVQCPVANDPLLPRREKRAHLSEENLAGPGVMLLLSEATGKPSKVW